MTLLSRLLGTSPLRSKAGERSRTRSTRRESRWRAQRPPTHRQSRRTADPSGGESFSADVRLRRDALLVVRAYFRSVRGFCFVLDFPPVTPENTHRVSRRISSRFADRNPRRLRPVAARNTERGRAPAASRHLRQPLVGQRIYVRKTGVCVAYERCYRAACPGHRAPSSTASPSYVRRRHAGRHIQIPGRRPRHHPAG